jgi:LysM domain-containing protein
MRRRTKTTPLGRLVGLVLVLMVGAVVGAAGAAATRPHAQAWRCITVRPGDTLWTLASRQPAPDRREAVQTIVDHNRLGAQALAAGSSIWIPNEGDLQGLLHADAATCPVAH